MLTPRAFTATLVSSGRSFTVSEDCSVLEAAIAAGVHLPYACRGGSCGACMARVVEGEVRYRVEMPPPGLTDEMLSKRDALLCVARPCGDLLLDVQEISRADQVVTRRLPTRVERMERLNQDVMVLHLRLPAVERLQFLAGQYLDVLLDDGRRRSFSIANAPHDDQLIELHVGLVEGGSFSSEVFTTMQPRSLLRIEAPLGSFFVRDQVERPQIMVAGGTGFAPIKSIIEDQLHTGLTQPIHLYWGASTAADLYMEDRVQEWMANEPLVRFTPVLSGSLSEPLEESSSEWDEAWAGRRGLVHQAVLTDFPDLSGVDVYAAGPPAMITALRDGFVAQGLPEQRLFSDSFEYAVA